MSQAIPIDDLLRERGFDMLEAAARGRQLLEEAGLTRPGKTGIAVTKLDAIEDVLDAVTLVCDAPACRRLATRQYPEQEQVVVSATSCTICGGSDITRAATLMIERLERSAIRRLLILGGTPVQHQQLTRLLADTPVELRCIDGSEGAHTKQQATANLEWADLLVIWASTPLKHKVSQAYSDTALQRSRAPRITVPRRSPTALCQAVVEHVGRG